MTSCIAVEVCMIAILLLSLGLGLAVPIGAIIATTNLLSLVLTYLFQLSRQRVAMPEIANSSKPQPTLTLKPLSPSHSMNPQSLNPETPNPGPKSLNYNHQTRNPEA